MVTNLTRRTDNLAVFIIPDWFMTGRACFETDKLVLLTHIVEMFYVSTPVHARFRIARLMTRVKTFDVTLHYAFLTLLHLKMRSVDKSGINVCSGPQFVLGSADGQG